ncbi:MAG: hemerythrin domain-containing protein [Patescibacteria group bacterium]|jgi:iron-sulfur cluster repair protein YtfE (RIC family)
MNLVSKFMQTDHNHLDKLWSLFFDNINDTNNSSKHFQQFKKNLLLHMKLEEDFLFPRLSEYLGFEKKSGLTEQVRRDHGTILKLLSFVEQADLAHDFEKTKMMGENVYSALKKHLAREQKIQYPVSDSFIKPDEWHKMLDEYHKKIELINK